MLTKQEALAKIEELKKYVGETDQKKEEKAVGIAIKTIGGSLIFQSTKTTYKGAVEEARSRGADLSGADFRSADLFGADFGGADLSGADFSGANLRSANLRGANLCGTNLCGANLSGVELCHALFYGKGGTKELTKAQLPDFLAALGFVVKD